ncbi:MAG TPA: hypothetical protein VMT29_08825 [Steroidobacteraceae bacterium]|nr:hypothetical protein [Steroidobacteraceae bacterium]
MNEPLRFDPTFLAEVIARRWQQDRGFYSLNTHADQGWFEGLWPQRADHSGVEIHWIRRAGLHRASELASRA